MPDISPAARSNQAPALESPPAAPAPLQSPQPPSSGATPSLAQTPGAAPLAAPAPAKISRPEKGVSPAPVQVAKTGVSTLPLADKTVSPATQPAAQPLIQPATQKKVTIVPNTSAVEPTEPLAAIHQTTAKQIESLAYQNLIYVESLTEIETAIHRVSTRVGSAGGQFSWVRGAAEPPVAIASLETLQSLIVAVLGENHPDFSAKTLLEKIVDQLPPNLAELVKNQTSFSLQLEGLWVELPNTGIPDSTTNQPESIQTKSAHPGLRLALSISVVRPESSTESSPKQNTQPNTKLGPFSIDRIYLTFGEFQS